MKLTKEEIENGKFTKKLKNIKEKDVSDILMKQVAEELNVPLSWVREAIVNGQSKYTAHTMKSGSFDGVRWPFLGKFTVKAKSAQVLKHLKGLTPIQKDFFLMRKEFAFFKRVFDNGRKRR